MRKISSVGISLPPEIISNIDTERGDISRSRYVLRALQNTFSSKEKLKEEKRRSIDTTIKSKNSSQDSPDRRLRILQSSESRSI